MAPTPPQVLTVYPWPMFQAVLDGKPLIGGKLYTYAPSTSTPLATFLDPGLVNRNVFPVTLNDQGAHTIYLSGPSDLRLTDAENVLLWSVDDFEFSSGVTPGPGGLIMGSTEATLTPTPGAAILPFPSMAPVGYRVVGVSWTVTADFGTSQGLTAISLGDAVAADRWARLTVLTAGTTGGQLGHHAGDQPVAAPSAYTLLAQAEGGLFDATGSLHCTVFWETIPADAP